MSLLHSHNLDFRPAAYWTVPEAIFANVKGAHRREMIRAAVGSGQVDMLPPTLLADALPRPLREVIASMHPSLMGGEYLPDAAAREVEIARVTLSTTTTDVISIRARPVSVGVAYRVVDEYGTTFKSRPKRSRLPLTFRQLIRLIDTACDVTNGYCGLVVGLWDYNVDECGLNPADRLRAIVTSDYYPELARWYAGVAARWDRSRGVRS